MASTLDALDTIAALRGRMARLEEGTSSLAARPLETHPALSGLVQLRAGGSYTVDSATLALALLAGPSRAGAWCGVVGVADFGAEAAAALGVDLDRTVLVPEPEGQWLEVAAALADVATLVVLRPPAGARGRVAPTAAERLGARLRKRGSALVVWGEWPRCEARLTTRASAWSGLEHGAGHLRTRRILIEVQRGSAPPRRGALWMPDERGRDRRDESWAPTTAASVEGVA